MLGFGLTRRRAKRSFANYAALNETLRRTCSSRRRDKDRKLLDDSIQVKARQSETGRKRKNKEIKFTDKEDLRRKTKNSFKNDKFSTNNNVFGKRKEESINTDAEWEEMVARRHNKTEAKKAKKQRKENKRKRQQQNKHKKHGLDNDADNENLEDDNATRQKNPRPSVTNVAKGFVQSVQKFGNDISDATGQLLNNVNSMSPTLETWTK
ncbi:hypothetical protein BIW11_09140 [Tropilaelaps mercedesae]|uniref:Uncharacterized protein n=1 Tax=Tropilaelaps mercedesae TaxID=418985 RepID=A0A1V9XLD5_9ACAR|nr:hypothetical protein BIW11_09140 [Tropilaelaps mercedesae]